MTTILRARVAHTPRDPFPSRGALEAFDDGAIAYDADGTITAAGAFDDVRAKHPGADGRRSQRLLPLPGFVDTHVHFPQIPVIGAMGLQLLDWLAPRTLPRGGANWPTSPTRAAPRRRFLPAAGRQRHDDRARVRHPLPGTPRNALFEEAEASGLRIASGLVVSDRNLLPELEVTPEAAYRASQRPAATAGTATAGCATRSRRASASPARPRCSTPARRCSERRRPVHQPRQRERSARSTSSPALPGGARLPRHLRARRPAHRPLACWPTTSTSPTASSDASRRSRTAIAHCPSSNAFLASGIFPMARHVAARRALRHGHGRRRRHGP